MIRRIVGLHFLLLVLVPGTGLADCSSPVGVEGAQWYNPTAKTMQFCDGTDWIDMRSGIVSGSVMAFNSSSCPSGWTAVSSAAGRFIVGVGTLGNETYSLGGTGGEAFHELTVSEMPAHTHSAAVASSQKDENSQFGPTGGFYANSSSTGSTGGGEAHENRPPYLALLFCEKD